MKDTTLQNLRPGLKWRLIGILGKTFIDILFRTIRTNYRGQKKNFKLLSSKKLIFAFWHSRTLPVSYAYKGWKGVALVSQSEDGEIIAQILHRQGQDVIRGSTTTGGGRALVKMIRALREKARPGGMIPDGPQGPRFKAQPGVISLAKKTGYPILPVTASFSKMKIFSSWDRFILPNPFSKCLMIYGKPIYVPENSDKNAEEDYRKQLEIELNRITREADRFYGHDIC